MVERITGMYPSVHMHDEVSASIHHTNGHAMIAPFLEREVELDRIGLMLVQKGREASLQGMLAPGSAGVG